MGAAVQRPYWGEPEESDVEDDHLDPEFQIFPGLKDLALGGWAGPGQVNFRGRIQVGVGEARSRKKHRLSQSVQRAGRTQPTQRTLRWAYILYTNVAT